MTSSLLDIGDSALKFFQGVSQYISGQFDYKRGQPLRNTFQRRVNEIFIRRLHSFPIQMVRGEEAGIVLEKAFYSGQEYCVDFLVSGPFRDQFRKVFLLNGKKLIIDWIKRGRNGPFAVKWIQEIGVHQGSPVELTPVERIWLTIAGGWKLGDKRPDREFYREFQRLPREEKKEMYRAACYRYRFPFLVETIRVAVE